MIHRLLASQLRNASVSSSGLTGLATAEVSRYQMAISALLCP